MTCLEAQGLTTPFLDNKLDPDQLEAFLDHVNHCDDCREELEVYYTLLKGMKLLDEDKNLSNNFHIDFENMLKKEEERIVRRKIGLIQKRVALVLIMGAIAFLMNFGVEEIVQKNILPTESYTVTGAYKLNNYYFASQNTKLNEIFFENYHLFYQYQTENNTGKTEEGDSDEK